MTLDEALLLDAEWWTTGDTSAYPIGFVTEIFKIKEAWGNLLTANGESVWCDVNDTDVECYFNLLIREAIK